MGTFPSPKFVAASLVAAGTSGQYDGQISVTGGGSAPGAGELKLTADFQHFYTYDNTEQFRVGNIPGAVEFWQAQGGLAGDGATLYAGNGTTTGNVDGNFVATGTGAFLFGNYNGVGFKIGDSGNITNGTYWTATPGLSSATPPKLSSSEDGQIDAPAGHSVLLSTNGDIHAKATNLDGTGNPLVNFWGISGSSTGQLLHLEALGTDSTINAYLRTKGAGGFTFANGSGGTILTFNGSAAGTAVSPPNFRASSATDPVRIFATDSIAIGGPATAGAMATTATTGFIMIPFGAGAPTGTPTKLTVGVPLYFDTTNVKLWAYTGGAWKGAAFT